MFVRDNFTMDSMKSLSTPTFSIIKKIFPKKKVQQTSTVVTISDDTFPTYLTLISSNMLMRQFSYAVFTFILKDFSNFFQLYQNLTSTNPTSTNSSAPPRFFFETIIKTMKMTKATMKTAAIQMMTRTTKIKPRTSPR